LWKQRGTQLGLLGFLELIYFRKIDLSINSSFETV
jgi:hypothetical protein